MGRKTPPYKNNPLITEAKFRSDIISALRNASRWWGPAQAAKQNACVGTITNKKTGKKCKHYLCASCQGIFPDKDVKIDHLIPVIDPNVGHTTWDEYIDRMFAPTSSYQILCDPCHDKKTNKEKELSRQRNERNTTIIQDASDNRDSVRLLQDKARPNAKKRPKRQI